MNHVYSTLSNDQAYTSYLPGGADLPIPDKKVLIKGGTNVADKRIITPLGVHTAVTDDELAFLEQNSEFQRHKANGFIRVEQRRHDPEKIAADMQSRDKSAPLVPEDFTGENEAKLRNGNGLN